MTKLSCENCDSKHFRIIEVNGTWYAQCVSCDWVYTFQVTLTGKKADDYDDLQER